LLQSAQAAGVVVVGVTVEQQLHVAGLISQGGDVPQYPRGGLHESAVDQDEPLRGDDQIAGDVCGADVVQVAEQLERGDRLVPRARDRVLLGPSRAE
jgi:hypothetical protein